VSSHQQLHSVGSHAEPTCDVLDYILLCRTKPDISEEDVNEAYSEIMSLMYIVPKIVIGFTGPVKSVWMGKNSEADKQAAPFSHALHFRLADRYECMRLVVPSASVPFSNHWIAKAADFFEVVCGFKACDCEDLSLVQASCRSLHETPIQEEGI
jgi:hypothetical protein